MTSDQHWILPCATIAAIPVDYAAIPLARLIEACVRGENAAWDEFARRYNSIIVLTVSRVARRWRDYSPHTVDDLVADTYLKLSTDGARALRKFQFDHENAMFGFLKVVARNVAIDYFKKLKIEEVPLDEYLEPEPRATGPGVLTHLELGLLFDELLAYLRTQLPPETRHRDVEIFWLRYRQNYTAKQIADLPFDLTVKGVESVLHRLVELVRTWVESGGRKSGVASRG